MGSPATAVGQFEIEPPSSQFTVEPPTPAKATGDVISAQPAPGTWPWFKTKFWQAEDKATNLLPAAGATLGGTIGGMAGGPLGAVAGATIGGGAGAATKQLVRRADGMSSPQSSSEAAEDVGKEGLVQGVVQSATEGMGALAGPLEKSALTQYKRALAPTTKANKTITNNIAPEMINRGVRGGLDSIEDQATTKAAALRPQIDAAVSRVNPAATAVAGKQILSDLDKLKGQYIVAGKVANPEAVKAIEGVQDIVRQYGSSIKPEDLRSLRQIFDEPVAKANGYAGTDLATHYTLNAKEAAANSMRGILNSASPDVAALNKEIHFWLDVQRVAHESGLRQTGQQGGLVKSLAPLGAAAVGGLGFASHGAAASAEAAAAATMATLVAQAVRTPAWRTTSAVVKSRFANALASGDVGTVVALAARLGIAVPSMRDQNAPPSR